MLNSLLILGSTYKNKKLNIIFAIAWIIFMLIGSNLKTGLIFTIINFISFGLVFALGKLFSGKYSNKVIAISSILIWSMCIDIICYIMYPEFAMGQNIWAYIKNGILFNYKYIVYNVIVVAVVQIVKYILKLKANSREKEVAINS